MTTRRDLERKLDAEIDAIAEGGCGFSLSARREARDRIWAEIEERDELIQRIRRALDDPSRTHFFDWPSPVMRDDIAALVADALAEDEA
jgi:hypothetical protein